MRWVGPALASEGPTDDRFFSGVIRRTIEDVVAREFSDAVEVTDVVLIPSKSISDTVVELRKNAGSYNFVIYHHDIGGSRERALAEYIRPMSEAWARANTGDPLVFLLPVRETEAWALADGDAIRNVFGINWSDARLELPTRPSQVHRVQDPKRVLKGIADRASGRSVDYLTRLGELISLQQLAEVEAYAEWLHELTCALEDDLSLRRIARKGRGRA